MLQIAAEYEAATGNSVTHTAINKHFKKLGVPRDLEAKVRAKAKAMVSAAAVSGSVSIETTATDAQIINQSAIDMATVEISHRKDVPRARRLVMGMFSELDHQCENQEQYERLGELMESKDEKGVDKLNEAYRRVISFAGRVDNVKKLVDALKVAVDLERRVFRIDEAAEGNGSADDLIGFLKRGAAGG